MIFKIRKILSFFLIISVLPAQFISSSSLRTLPSELNGGLKNISISFLDPSRFSINQAFSMSMMNSDGQSISLASFANNINYKFSENIDLNANIVIMNPSGSALMNNKMNRNNAQIGYDAGITYRPTKNSLFQIQLASYNRLYYHNHYSGRIADRFTNYSKKNIFELD
tara:strand:- start:1034 stop:1537 length:504 start_codon:yes stop_codon:yes gene_type:complete